MPAPFTSLAAGEAAGGQTALSVAGGAKQATLATAPGLPSQSCAGRAQQKHDAMLRPLPSPFVVDAVVDEPERSSSGLKRPVPRTIPAEGGTSKRQGHPNRRGFGPSK